jgi:hypothetical protein
MTEWDIAEKFDQIGKEMADRENFASCLGTLLFGGPDDDVSATELRHRIKSLRAGAALLEMQYANLVSLPMPLDPIAPHVASVQPATRKRPGRKPRQQANGEAAPRAEPLFEDAGQQSSGGVAASIAEE